MKKMLFVIPILLLTFSCGRSFQIVVDDDPFGNSKVVKLNMWHKVIQGTLDNTETNYSREVKSSATSKALVNFTFSDQWMIEGSPDLERRGQLLIGSKVYKVNYKVFKASVLRVEHGSASVHGTGQAAHGSYTGTIRNIKTMKAALVLTPQQERGILVANKLMYRFYTAGTSNTIEATPKQLAKVKEFLQF